MYHMPDHHNPSIYNRLQPGWFIKRLFYLYVKCINHSCLCGH